MQALTLQELFGDSAYQSATELVIKKSDLVAAGLTATANNRAEQLLVAILLQALSAFQGYLTDESGNILSNETDSLGYKNTDLYEFLTVFIWDMYVKERSNKIFLTQTIIVQSYYAQTD